MSGMPSTRSRWLAAFVAALTTASAGAAMLGCGGAAATSPWVKITDAERTRRSLQERDVPALAPQAFAEADLALRSAKEAKRDGDKLAAELHAERAEAAYQHAIALARLARATDEATQANEALARAVEQSQRYAAARKTAEREADDVDKKLRVAREAERPSASRPTTPERERARLVAARSLATEARLLCGAARLVSAEAPGLADAETAAADLDKTLASVPKAAPIDAAARARAACLTALTKARRVGAPEAEESDALLGELSRSSDPKAKSTANLAPSRDERGVIVTLRSLFSDDKLTREGAIVLQDLGRVAAAHPNFGVQVVLHDATPPSSAEMARNAKRGDVIVKTLTEAGANSAKTKLEQAGARAPVFDPIDAKRRGANARVEIVFVGGS